MKPVSLMVLIAITVIILAGCASGTDPIKPGPDTGNIQELTSSGNEDSCSECQSQTHLWGYYDVYINSESSKVEVAANRSLQYVVNVTGFLNSSPTGVQISIEDVTSYPDCLDIGLNVTINHPLDDAGFDGYDVRGIFIGDGSGFMEYDSDLAYPVHGTDQVLLNADGYTRWCSPEEFTSPGVFGHIPGALASAAYSPSATLNGYKYFGEGLGVDDNLWTYLEAGDPQTGYFLHSTGNKRYYQIRFPIPVPGPRFGYAVIANWSGCDPANHPSHASEAVGLKLADFSTVYYENETSNGGDIDLYLKVFDWDAELTDGVMLDYGIVIESTVLLADYHLDTFEMTPTESGDHWHKYHVTIPATCVQGVEDNEFWVIIEDQDADYTNPFGVPNDADTDPLASFFRFDHSVSDTPPPPPDPWIELVNPDGGQVWETGTSEDILWESSEDFTGVEIKLSMDSGLAYSYTISPDTPNDGSFMWTDIPAECVSPNCRIRVANTAGGAAVDYSDSDFTIGGNWLEVIVPNGDEEWPIGTSQDIKWGCSQFTGQVYIEYSTDDFVSDINQIVDTTANDGEFTWDYIPYEISDNVKVRVYSVELGVSDVSDAGFSIVDHGWGRHWGGDDSDIDEGQVIATDSGGNVYTLGNFFGTVDFDPDPVDEALVTSLGSSDIYLTKFDSVGNFVWVVTFGGADVDEGYGLAIDGSDNICVSGDFRGTADVDPGLSTYYFTSSGASDVFITKLDPDGDFLWARQVGGISWDAVRGIAINVTGNVFVSGYFMGTADFDPGPGTHDRTSNGNADIYLLKLDQYGDYQWAVAWGGSDYDYSAGVEIDSDGWEVVSGTFMDTVDFDPGPGTDNRMSYGDTDVFLSRFNPLGGRDWTVTWGGSGTESIRGIATDAYGNSYVTGFFQDTVDFDPWIGIYNRTSNGANDAFVSKFTSTSGFGWARTWGSTGSESGTGIAVDASGDIHVASSFKMTVDFDPDAVGEFYMSSDSDSNDIALSVFSVHGEFQNATAIGGSDFDFANCVATDIIGNSYITGYFTSHTIDLAPTGSPCFEAPDVHTAVFDSDTFLIKYMPDGCW